MRDSPLATRDDHNSVVTMKRYRRMNQVATPKPTCGYGS
jgi:hypothetical protein